MRPTLEVMVTASPGDLRRRYRDEVGLALIDVSSSSGASGERFDADNPLRHGLARDLARTTAWQVLSTGGIDRRHTAQTRVVRNHWSVFKNWVQIWTVQVNPASPATLADFLETARADDIALVGVA